MHKRCGPEQEDETEGVVGGLWGGILNCMMEWVEAGELKGHAFGRSD